MEEGRKCDGVQVHGWRVGKGEEFLVDFVGHAYDSSDVGEVVRGVVIGHEDFDVGRYGLDDG